MSMEFVTFEIAKKLKEKGFIEQCLAYYTKDSNFYYNTSYCSHVGNAFKSFNCRPDHICGKRMDAPTICQVLKWMRERKKIFVEIALSPEGYRHIIYTGLCCTNTSSASYYLFDGFYNHENNYMTYEQATIAGIEYVLDNLI